MTIIFAVLTLFSGTLWYIYDLQSTRLYMTEYLIGISRSGDLPHWIAWLITEVLIVLAMFLPSLLQWAIANPLMRSHPAFGWLFIASVGFDFVTDAPLVMAHVDTYLLPRIALWFTDDTLLLIAKWVVYLFFTVMTSVALQTITVVLAAGAWTAWQRRGKGHGTAKQRT
jgi:hypothetical protein